MLLVLLFTWLIVAEVNVDVFWEERQSAGLSKGRKLKH